MPIFKYTLFVGASLLALIAVADRVIAPAPAGATSASNSLEILRKMANHGEVRGFAPLAYAGPFLPMPVIVPSMLAAAEPAAVESTAPSSALNAQARVVEADLVDKPMKPEKKTVTRKPKPRTAYVENGPRAQDGLFGVFNTW